MVWGFASTIINYVAENPAILIAIFLIYVFIFVLSVLFTGPKPGRNPFKTNKARPPQPLVTDHAVRDRVLKQGFNVKRIPDNVDVIVIGSGIGGLGVAATLSKAGKKVLVLEQHDQAGGCCHTFIDKGFEFDVGIHYIGEMRHNTISKLLIEQWTEGQLEWTHLLDEFDVVAMGEPGKQKYYPFHSGNYEDFKASMLEKFPEEEEVLDKYIALLKEVKKSMLGQVMLKTVSKWIVRFLIMTGLIHWVTKYFLLARRSLQEVLDELTDNQDLKAVLGYSFGDYGTLPGDGSFAMHAALINHMMQGGSYPRGGASEIAFHMIPVIEKAGGKVLVRAPVTQILINEKGRAHGVRVDRSSGPVDVFAPLIISDAGLVNTFKTLLPQHIADKSSMRKLIGSRVDSGVGAMSLFVGLNGTAEELGIKPQNIWAFTGNDLHAISEKFLSLSADEAAEAEVPLMFISFPSAKDPTYNDRFPGKTVCEVITLAKWDWFSKWEQNKVNKRGSEYETIKNGIARHMWDQTLAVFPQIADKVEYFDIGSPVTNNHYIASPKGEIYGLDHTYKRFGDPEVVMTLRAETDIPGLFLTGQDIMSCGFMGAAFGGLLCAASILKRNIYQDLINSWFLRPTNEG